MLTRLVVCGMFFTLAGCQTSEHYDLRHPNKSKYDDIRQERDSLKERVKDLERQEKDRVYTVWGQYGESALNTLWVAEGVITSEDALRTTIKVPASIYKNAEKGDRLDVIQRSPVFTLRKKHEPAEQQATMEMDALHD